MLLYAWNKFWDSTYRGDVFVLSSFGVSIFLNVLMWVLLYWQIRPLAFTAQFGQIPLHYNLFLGIDALGPWYMVFLLPIFGAFIVVLNNILGYYFYIKERVLSYSFVVVQLLVQLILFASAVFIIIFNT